MNESNYKLRKNQKIQLNTKGKIIEILVTENQLTITSEYTAVYGLGERYSSVNHKHHAYLNKVEEQFCNQNEKTYFPLPFFFTDEFWGLFIQTNRVINFEFEDTITIDTTGCEKDAQFFVLLGSPSEIITSFMKLSNEPTLPPKWSLGPWISAHRWNSEVLVQEQLQQLEVHKIPVTVMVLEQWSDEATFYMFEGSTFKPQNNPFHYDDFTFDKEGRWPNPKKMIGDIHNHGIRLLLWQCPVIKKLEAHEPINLQHLIDEAEVIQKQFIPINPDHTPYTIPKGHWFPGSMIPDFTNSQAIEWWFAKRNYLLEIGVDGFKTDGGEFIYQDDMMFHNGMAGFDMVNRYSLEYARNYHEFIGKDHVLFSRAGYLGQQQFPIQWAGDQQSTWSELRSVLNAGLSAGCSGQIFWGYDIGGFSGDLPSVELYKRSLQMAVFTPVMQLHSEPIGGQFSLMRPTKAFINDRTPWNMAEYYGDESLLEKATYYFNLRMNLLPTIYSAAIQAVNLCKPLLKHCIIDYPDDKKVTDFNEQYLFSHLLVAPILNEDTHIKEIYLPEGDWYHLFSQQLYKGNQKLSLPVNEDEIHVFVPSHTALILNTGETTKLGSYVGNEVSSYKQLTVNLYGTDGKTYFVDDIGNDFSIEWNESSHTIIGITVSKLTIVRI